MFSKACDFFDKSFAEQHPVSSTQTMISYCFVLIWEENSLFESTILLITE